MYLQKTNNLHNKQLVERQLSMVAKNLTQRISSLSVFFYPKCLQSKIKKISGKN